MTKKENKKQKTNNKVKIKEPFIWEDQLDDLEEPLWFCTHGRAYGNCLRCDRKDDD